MFFLILEISRLKENVIFESNVLDWLECGTSCFETRFCVGYNFKENSTAGQINCQLTYTGDQTFERINTEDNDWMFYKREGENIVRLFYQFSFVETPCKFVIAN